MPLQTLVMFTLYFLTVDLLFIGKPMLTLTSEVLKRKVCRM